jgi:hypothetical protein
MNATTTLATIDATLVTRQTTVEIPVEQIDALVNAVTAFRTWNEMRAALSTGYVPTMFGRNRKEKSLIVFIKTQAFNVWGNKGRNW